MALIELGSCANLSADESCSLKFMKVWFVLKPSSSTASSPIVSYRIGCSETSTKLNAPKAIMHVTRLLIAIARKRSKGWFVTPSPLTNLIAGRRQHNITINWSR